MTPPGEVHLTRDFTQIPVTALSFLETETGRLLAIAGEDTHIKVYDAESKTLIAQVRVFDQQPIHGICIGQNSQGCFPKVLVWGSKSFAIFSSRGVENGEMADIAYGAAPDWIYDGVLSPYDTSRAVLATAHNEVVVVRHEASACKVVIEEIISPTRPILYTADLAWVAHDCVLMAAGTAFGEILVWKSWPGRKVSSHEMLFVFNGHEGSIFGVDISPVMTMADGRPLQLLASCSDDRTIRIWDITETQESGSRYDHDSFSAPRETGFSAFVQEDSMKKPPFTTTEVAIAMGHLSRIWGVKFSLSNALTPSQNALCLYSFGEDSTTQRWKLDLKERKGGEPLSGTLKHKHTFTLHDGKHLWSHALLIWKERPLIATGGADSKISLIEEPYGLGEGAVSSAVHPLVTVELQNIPSPTGRLNSATAKTKKQEIVGRYDFISVNKLLVTTSTGRVLRGYFSQTGLEWTNVSHNEGTTVDINDQASDLVNTYVLKRTGHDGAVLGTTTGNLYLYNDEGANLVHLGVKYPRKIHDITILSGRTDDESNTLHTHLLCHMFGDSKPYYLWHEYSPGLKSIKIWENTQIAGLDDRFVCVSAAKITDDILAMGSRHGWISILKRNNGIYSLLLNYRSDSLDAITGIVPLPTANGEKLFTPSFLATSRDGQYRIYEIHGIQQQTPPFLRMTHKSSPPFGPMIEGAWFTKGPRAELILFGFRSREFVVWNETRREERAHVDCGGAHRTFSFYHEASDVGSLRFAFTKTSTLSIYSQSSISHQSIKNGTHGREIRALASGPGFMATGSEDTSIRIWKYQERLGSCGSHKEMQCLATIKKHVTGIQKLQWPEYQHGSQHGSMYFFSSGGNEEFIAWRVAKPQANYSGLGVVPECMFQEKSAHGDLRILDFDVLYDKDCGNFVITMAFSNSTLSTFAYTPGEPGFIQRAKGFYTGACLTQVKFLGTQRDAPVILTASTDGHLAIWKTREEDNDDGNTTEQQKQWTLQHVIKVHQSSIKCLHLEQNPGQDYYLIVTGGDDNALAVTALRKSDYSVLGRQCVRKAHAAAINGIAVVRQMRSGSRSVNKLTAMTVSNDQRLKAWRISTTVDGGGGGEGYQGSVELCADLYSGVADAGDIAILEDEERGQDVVRVAVAGVGMEIWNVGESLR